MQAFLQFMMRSRQHALLLAMVFAFLPFFSWVSSVIVALVTLRIGIWSGLYLVLWLSLPDIALAWLQYPKGLLFFGLAIASMLLVWASAVVLRLTISWRMVLFSLTTITLVGIGLVHMLVPELQTWWLAKFTAVLQQANKNGSLPIAEDEALRAIQPITANATGLLTLGLLVSVLSNLAIARWCQAMLYHPGGFKQELLRLKLTKSSAVILMLLVTVLLPSSSSLAQDVVSILLLPMVVVGIISLHGVLTVKRHATLWLVIFYGLLVLTFVQLGIISAIALAVIALLDSLFDITNRLKEGV
jgi:hypothetical protein